MVDLSVYINVMHIVALMDQRLISSLIKYNPEREKKKMKNMYMQLVNCTFLEADSGVAFG